MEAQLLILAYAWVLQYWAEEVSLPAPSEPHPLVMSVRQLRLCIGKYTTFIKPDVLQGLGNVIPEAGDGDMGAPPVDSTTLPATADAKDTWPGPVETPLVDDTTVLAAKPDAQIQKDLPTAWGASPAELEGPPCWWISWPVLLPWLTIQ